MNRTQPMPESLRRLRVLPLAVAAALSLGFATTAFAGTGSIDTANKTIDLNALFTYQETTANLTGATDPTWKKVFNEASKRLWNATNGQLRIGKVKAYLRALSKKDDADIWIAKNAGGAYATGVAKLGVAGDHMQFYGGTHRSLSGYKGDFSIVHEMGHYVFGAYDEYLGSWVPFAKKDSWTNADLHGWISNDPNIYSISATDAVASIMDGGGGLSPQNDRTEFDTAGNVNKGVHSGTRWYMTKQWIMHKESAWETMGKFQWNGVNVFSTVPAGASPTDMPAGFSDIQFEVIPTLNRLVLTIDHSGSMDYDNKLELAKLGASIFVSLADEPHSVTLFKGTADEETITFDPDHLGVVEFDDSVATIFAMTAIDAAGTVKANARAAIAGIGSGGNTAIGDGVQQSLGLIQSQGDKVSGEVVILLSDGQDNSSSIAPSTAAANAKAREAKIYSIGLGSDVDAGTLSGMALTTGGKYYQATDGLALTSIYAKIYSDLKGGGLVDALSSLLKENEQTSHAVHVDTLTEEVTFAITSADTGWNFSIKDPDGTVYTGSAPGAGVTFEDSGNALRYRVAAPKSGAWTLFVKAPAGSSGHNYQYNVLTSASSPTVQLTVAPDRDSYVYPQPVLVTAKLAAGDPVAGAKVTAEVTGPNGIIGQMQLYDDGSPAHGDETANDGRYAAYFRSMTASGVYTFDVTADNQTGYQGIAEPEKTAAAFQPQSLPSFTRTTSFAVEVSGVPPAAQNWLRVDAMQLNRSKTGDTATINLAATLNNIGLSTDQLSGIVPIGQDLQIVVGGYFGNASALIRASDFKKKGKASGLFAIRSSDGNTRGTLKANIGGTSRSELVLKLKNVPLNGLSLTSPQDVRVTWGGFDNTVSLNLKATSRSLRYVSGKNYSNTEELYVNGILAKVRKLTTNGDTFRMVANYSGAGGSYNPAGNTLTVSLGGFELSVPPGTLASVANGKVAKGQVPFGSGSIKINVNVAKHLLTLRGSRLNLAGLLSESVIAGLDLADFSRRNLLVLAHQQNKALDRYSY